MLQELERQKQTYKSARDRLMKPPKKVVKITEHAVTQSVPVKQGALPKFSPLMANINVTYFQPPTIRASKVYGSEPKCRDIIRIVSKFYNVEVGDILSPRRFANLITPRHVAMYLCVKLTHRSLPQIGREFDGRDHTTIMNGRNKIAARLLCDEPLADEVFILRVKVSEYMASGVI